MWRLKTGSWWKCCSKTKPSGKPNRDSSRSGWLLNRNEGLPNIITGVPNAPHRLNEELQAQDRISRRWLTLYCTGEVENSWTNFWTRYARISTPTTSYSHEVGPIKSNMRSLFWMPGAITKCRHSDIQWWHTLRNGRVTYLPNPAHAYRTSTSCHRR